MTSVSNSSDDTTPIVPFPTASQRIKANRWAINAYRQGSLEPRIVPLPVDSCDFDRTLPSLEDAIASVRESEHLHVCRSCNAPLLPGHPCGAHCSRCSDEAAELHRLDDAQDRRVLYAFVTGAILCGVAIIVLAKVFGWIS